ncbi:methylmalonyl-CoA mutase family protein [Larkinella sp. VNQ87]|uniref:methylmalonyl-CoA mutase family protein n=1 Tax=Larkinella sp. VNQ87 TaxID=3400921 RepID=UPI003C0E4715
MTELNIKALFSPVTKAQWTQQVVADLKGKPFASLQRLTPDGFVTEPFYTPEDVDNLTVSKNRQALQRTPGWLTMPTVRLTTETDANAVLRDTLAKGADALWLDLRHSNVADLDWARLLNGLKLSDTPVWFRTEGHSGTLVNQLKPLLPYQLRGGLVDEPMAHLLQTGDDPTDALTQLAQATRLTLDSPQFRTLTIGSHVFHNAGATASQELAFTLNALVELYDYLTDNGLSIAQLLPKTMLSVSVGTSYFTEIAKLRALRILWQRLIVHYSVFDIHYSLFLHAQTSTFYDAAATPDTNLLRATTEAMAAVIGGCDALTVHPYDAVFREPDEFSIRIARNVSILLQEEAHLDKTTDPAAGSYYLETLTQQLVEAAWALFLDVEQRGGLQAVFRSGFLQNEIEIAYQAQVEAVKAGRILVGVTRFRTEEAGNSSLANHPTAPDKPGLLLDRRLAATFE